MLTNKVENIIGLSGSLLMPCIGFYIPVALESINAPGNGRSVTLIWVIHDVSICLFGSAMLVLRFKEALRHILVKKYNIFIFWF